MKSGRERKDKRRGGPNHFWGAVARAANRYYERLMVDLNQQIFSPGGGKCKRRKMERYEGIPRGERISFAIAREQGPIDDCFEPI